MEGGGKPIPNKTQAAVESGIHRPSTAALPRGCISKGVLGTLTASSFLLTYRRSV